MAGAETPQKKSLFLHIHREPGQAGEWMWKTEKMLSLALIYLLLAEALLSSVYNVLFVLSNETTGSLVMNVC